MTGPLCSFLFVRKKRKREQCRNSWQWHVLHQGRYTTSKLYLVFLEPTTSQVLGIPLIWRHGAYKAFVRIRQEPVIHIRTLDDMNALLLNESTTRTRLHYECGQWRWRSNRFCRMASVWQTPPTPSSSTNNSSTKSSTTDTEGSSNPEETTSNGEQQLLFMTDYIHQPSTWEKVHHRRNTWPSPIRLYWGNKQLPCWRHSVTFPKNSTSNGCNVTLVKVGM